METTKILIAKGKKKIKNFPDGTYRGSMHFGRCYIESNAEENGGFSEIIGVIETDVKHTVNKKPVRVQIEIVNGNSKLYIIC